MSDTVVPSLVTDMSDRQSSPTQDPTSGVTTPEQPRNAPSPESTGISTPEQAVDRAVEALAAEGHPNAEAASDPFRTTGTWVVPAEAESERFNVHINAADGSTSVAHLDR